MNYPNFLDEKPLFQNKKFLHDTHFLVTSYFARRPITLLLEIWRDGCMGRPLTFFGDRPSSSPISLRPCYHQYTSSIQLLLLLLLLLLLSLLLLSLLPLLPLLLLLLFLLFLCIYIYIYIYIYIIYIYIYIY